MLFVAIVATFVVVCCVIVLAAAVRAFMQIRADRSYLAEQIEEDIQAGVFPEWLYEGPRMDMVRKHPVLRTRSTKSR